MGVDDDPGGDAKGLAEDDLGGFASNPGQRNKGIHVGRHLSAMILVEDLRRGAQRRRFPAEHPGRPDHFFDLAMLGGRKVCRSRPTSEELGCDLVDADIGALGRENRGHQQLPVRPMIELAPDICVLAAQQIDDSGDALRQVHDQYLKAEPPMNSRMIEV